MFRAVKTCTKNLWKMSSLAETMKQLRALNGLVEKLRAETRSFLEAKDREFVSMQSICEKEKKYKKILNGQRIADL